MMFEDCRKSLGAFAHGRSALLAAALSLLALNLSACPKSQPQQEHAAGSSATLENEQPLAAEETRNPVTDTSALDLEQFVNAVVDDLNEVWTGQFAGGGRTYSAPELQFFDDAIGGICNFAEPASGPFYCAEDNTLYIDKKYMSDLRGRDDAPGDLAAAYVIAHLVGHHVQNLLGYTAEVDSMRASLAPERSAELTLRFELQADFMAGLWTHHADMLPAEVTRDSAEAALTAVGELGQGMPALEDPGDGFAPDPLTHGTLEQRLHWFMRGFETGDIAYATTFKDDI